MKHILITTIAAVLMVGCGQSEHQHSHDDDHRHAEGQSGGHDKDSDGKTGAELKAAGPVEGVKAATQSWADAFNSRVLDKILAHYSAEAVFW